MNETIKGKISIVKDVQKGTSKAGKEWQKLEFVITNNDGYEGKEQLFCFELFGAEKVENFIKFNKPHDRLLNSQVDRLDWFRLRKDCLQHQYQQQQKF